MGKMNSLEAQDCTKRLLVIVLLGLFLCGFVSAGITTDFVKDNDKSTSLTNYGTITLKDRSFIDIFGWFEKTVEEITLKENTEECFEDCYAIKEITLYEKGKLVDGVKFETIKSDGSRIEQPIKSYQFYIKTGETEINVDDYKWQCEDMGLSSNGSMEESCGQVITGSHKEYIPKWKEYNYEELEAGDYTLKLEGKKKPLRIVDWIITSQGEEIREWSTWGYGGTGGLRGYWTLDETSGSIAYDTLELHDAILTNVSFTPSGFINGGANNTYTTGTASINTTYAPAATDTDITFNFWINFGSLESLEPVCFKGSYDCLTPDSNGEFRTYTGISYIQSDWYDGTSRKQADTPSTLVTGTWQMITFIINQSHITGYVDAVNGTPVAANAFTWTGNDIFFPWVITGSSANGTIIDEIGIWNRTLTQAELDALYNAGAGSRYFLTSSITLNSPANNYTSVIRSVTFNAIATVISGAELTNMSLWTNKSGTFQRDNYTELTGTENTSIMTMRFNEGIFLWGIEACDSDGDCGFSSNRTLKIDPNALIENSQTYNISTSENSLESFIVNISFNPIQNNLITANLYYNGTLYTPTTSTTYGSDMVFSKSVLIPSVPNSANVSFNWEFLVTNASGTTRINSTTNKQYIDLINASILNNPYTINFLNFTVYDEENLSIINSTFAVTFQYGKSSFIRTLSYENILPSEKSYSFSFFPYDKPFIVKGQIDYSSGSDMYASRTYILPSTSITNTTTNISLYLINQSKLNTFAVLVRDSSYASIQGANVYIQRYYPGTDTYNTVQVLETNIEGKAYAGFVQETVQYRFLVYVNGVLRLTTSKSPVVCEVAYCTITLTLTGEPTYVPIANISGLAYSLTYSKATETFTYSYIDSNSTAQGGRLFVIKSSFGNASVLTVCNTTSPDATAVLVCDISSYANGTYYGFAYNTRNGVESKVANLIIEKTINIVASIGVDGLLWSIFFIIAIVMIGLFKPAVAVVFAIAGVIFIRLLGLASIPYISLFAIIVIGAFLLWQMKQ